MTSRPVTDEEAYLESLANAICQRRLGVPALFLLDAGRPLALLLAQLLWIVQPTVRLLTRSHDPGRVAELLERPSGVEALIAAIEARSNA